MRYKNFILQADEAVKDYKLTIDLLAQDYRTRFADVIESIRKEGA